LWTTFGHQTLQQITCGGLGQQQFGAQHVGALHEGAQPPSVQPVPAHGSSMHVPGTTFFTIFHSPQQTGTHWV
jgi:hypothetical protein